MTIFHALRRSIPGPVKDHLRHAVASAKNAVGLDHFTARFRLDRQLLAYVGHIHAGVFVEAGAYDGVNQSNTWHLERRLGWTGLLIEPIPETAARCRRWRRAIVECCALGSYAREGSSLTMYFGGLMTTADGAEPLRMLGGSPISHAAIGASEMKCGPFAFTAPVVALSTLLDRHGISRVDLFSLDVEGLELEVLGGIDFERHSIDYILVETLNPDEIAGFLASRYLLVDRLAGHDYLFRRVGVGRLGKAPPHHLERSTQA